MLAERPEIIVVSKCELPDAPVAAEFLAEETGLPVLQISAVTGTGLQELTAAVLKLLREMGDADELPKMKFRPTPAGETTSSDDVTEVD